MKPLKVYLAKSNRANPETVQKVRKYLKQFKQIEVLEWICGRYREEEVSKADTIIFITENPATFKNSYYVGKGLLSQLVTFVNSRRNCTSKEEYLYNSFVVSDIESNLYLSNIIDYGVYDKNDWISKYGEFQTDGMCMDMWTWEAFPSKYYELQIIPSNNNQPNLLLICD